MGGSECCSHRDDLLVMTDGGISLPLITFIRANVFAASFRKAVAAAMRAPLGVFREGKQAPHNPRILAYKFLDNQTIMPLG